MRQRTVVFIVMWGAALAVVATFWWSSAPAEDAEEPPLQEGLAVTVRRPDQPSEVGPRGGLPPPEDVPSTDRFRADPRHSGRSERRGPETPALVWSFETGGRISGQVAVGADAVFVGSHDHSVYSLDLLGRERWRRDLGGAIYSSPALLGSRLYVGSDAHRFFCLSADDGETHWSLETRGDADTGATFSRDGAVVYFAAGDSLYAVSAVDGEVRWRFQADQKVYTSPAVDVDGVVYFGSQDDHVYAVDPAGRLVWKVRTRGDVDSSPAISDEGHIVFGSDDGHVYSVDRDGQVRWAAEVGGYVRAPVAFSRDGAVVAGTFGPRPGVVALDADTGERRWFFPVTVAESTETGIASGPLVDADGAVYIGAHDDYVYGITPEGRLRWVFETGSDVDGDPLLAEDGRGRGLMLVGSDDGRLYALSAP